MLPDNTISVAPVPSPFIGAAAAGGDSLTAYADGGVALNDPSQGLTGQLWRARVVGGQVVLDSPTHTAIIVLDANPTHISIAFDRNMALLLAWVEGGLAFLRWPDPLTGELAVIELGGVITPRLALDDARPTGATTSDVILAYIRDGGLYHRRQRDRFEVEIPLDDGPFLALRAMGGNEGLRLQFNVQRPGWPEILPMLLLPANKMRPANPQARTTLQNGREIVRRQFSGVPEPFTAQWVLDDAQASALEAFFWGELDAGSRWFEMPMRLPQELGPRLVRFRGALEREQLTGGEVGCARWRYSAEMEHYLAWQEGA